MDIKYKNVKTLSIINEWDFVAKEITSSKKHGTQKGEMLFEFQMLLYTLQKSQSSKERQILKSTYQKRKAKYNKLK